jgi:CubicO group peptidase (beta-lactamase class C family)
VDAMKTVKPFRPAFIYSQWNYCLLQLIVKRVTGQSFGTHVHDAIFEPLGLKTATFDDPTGSNVVSPHAVLSDGSVVSIPIGPYSSISGLTAASGGKASLNDQLHLYIDLLTAYQDQMARGTNSTPNSPFTPPHHFQPACCMPPLDNRQTSLLPRYLPHHTSR